MNPHTVKRLSQVHPLLRQRVEAIIARMADQGITLEVVQGLRTAKEQNELYAQGRSKPGRKVTNAKAWQSFHNYGIAVDLCPFVDGKPQWDAPRKVWNAIGAEAERLHLEWGGRWKFRDLPHVQMPGLSISQCFDLSKAGSLTPVWDAISRINQNLAIKSPSVDFSASTQGNKVAPKSQKSKIDGIAAKIPASDKSLLPGFYPSKPAKVPAQAGKQAAESLKTGNTLPVSLVTIQAACELFLRENGLKLLLWLTLSILIALLYHEWRERQAKRKERR